MPADGLLGWALASLLVGLRIAPVLGFAPPFTLTRTPAIFRLLLGIGIAGLMAALRPLPLGLLEGGALIAAAATELFVGLVFVTVLQLMFGALYLAGRTVDIQAGFGLATLIDPTTQGQAPLVGSILAYAAGAVFFTMGGHHEVMRLLAASLDAVPIGEAVLTVNPTRMLAFFATITAAGFGVVGGAILALYLADLAIALMSRTLPQMNVLILGLQVKTLLLLTVLPLGIGVWGALLARLVRMTLEQLLALL